MLTVRPPRFIRTDPGRVSEAGHQGGIGRRRAFDPWPVRIMSAGFSRWGRARGARAWDHPVIRQTRAVDMFKNVVWATDGSAHADRALEYAKRLVPPDGGTLHVVYIVEKLLGPRIAGQ